MLQNKLSAAIVPANRPSTRLHKIQLLPLAITAARLPIYIYLYRVYVRIRIYICMFYIFIQSLGWGNCAH